MKLLSFEAAGKRRFGAVAGDGIVDLTGESGSLREALAANAPAARLREAAAARKPRFALAEDVPDAHSGAGEDHLRRRQLRQPQRGIQGRLRAEVPERVPRLGSFVGHRAHLLRPPESAQLDYEGEIAIVIGTAGRRIAEADAERHIAGLTCLNEGTIRDWTKHGKFNVTQGKNWDASGAIGPWLVTADEFAGYGNLRVTTRVNGEVRQDDTTANLIFPFRHLIHYISTWTTLQPGDVIATGTPVGAGVRFDPPRFLEPGDVVEVEVPGVGTLCNTVADERC